VTAYDRLTHGCGLYVVDERHVARARWWLAAHPRTRDRAAMLAGLGREIAGLRALRSHDIAELMGEVMDGVCCWSDPATWPSEWPEAWGRGEAPAPVERVIAQVEPDALRELAPTPPAPARASALPRAEAPPRGPRARRTPALPRKAAGADDARPEPIAGVPRWEGHPVRASRIPVHLMPEHARGVGARALWVLWQIEQWRRLGEVVTFARAVQLTGLSQSRVYAHAAELREAGLLTKQHRGGRRGLAPGRPLQGGPVMDLPRCLSLRGRMTAAQLPAELERAEGVELQRDASDMALLWHLLRRDRVAQALRWHRVGDIEAGPGMSSAPYIVTRLEASEAVETRWAGAVREVRLLPEVARAWGVSC